jgi:hypothetical protein
MQSTLATSHKPRKKFATSRPDHDVAKVGSKEAHDEIRAYVAIRDLLLHDAEVTTTAESLRRATIANEFVETCLQSPRSPYEAQHLERSESESERARCSEVRAAITRLQHKL